MEIRDLRDSLLYKSEPICKAFILGSKDSPIEGEIKAYRQDHPHTRVVVLARKNCCHNG